VRRRKKRTKTAAREKTVTHFKDFNLLIQITHKRCLFFPFIFFGRPRQRERK